MITKRQKEVLDFVTKYQGERGYAASLEEIRKHFKLASVSTAHFHIKKLENSGYLKKEENQPRAIDVFLQEKLVKVPLLGTIAAGQPIEAIQEKETIAVPQSKLPRSGDIYALRVVGNSMIDENINDGDVVLVRQQGFAENGEKVVALIDNHEATLKKFYRERGHIRLQPANKDIEPIIIKKDRDIAIQGIVIDVIKNQQVQTLFSLPLEVPRAPNETRHIKENQIINGDVIEQLKNLPDKSIDLVIADPPYNLSKGNHINFNNNGLKGFGGEWNKVMENWDNLSFSDYLKFTFAWLTQVKRVLKPTGSIWVFGTYHNIGVINIAFQALNIEIINEVIWYKRNAFPNLAGRRLTASHETLLWGHVGEKKRQYFFDYKKSKEYHHPSDLMKVKDKQMRTVWDIPNNKEAREMKHGKHPTQKPLSVCKRIVSISSKQGDIVLAPFAGAGSECVAAKELGRKYIGFELEQQYVDIAEKRLSASTDLFS